jgi:HlyD family secretion protein
MIRILLVDDQFIIRQGLQAILQSKPQLKVVGTANDGNSAIAQTQTLRPDVVLMDIEMPDMDGITTTHKICQQFPETKVLVLSSHENKTYVVQALKAGAEGYLLKDTLADGLEQAIWSVYRGHLQIESKLLRELLAGDSFSPSIKLIAENESTLVAQQSGQKRQFESNGNVDKAFGTDEQYLLEIDEHTEISKNGSHSQISKTIAKPTFEQSESELKKLSSQSNKTWDINNCSTQQETKESLHQLDVITEHKPQQKKGIFPKFPRSGKWWISGLVIVPTLLIISITLFYLRTSKSSAKPVSQTQTVPKAVAAIGYLEPQGEVINISAPAFLEGSRVEQLLVKRGEAISKGQTIALLDDRSRLQAALVEAQKQVQTSQARLAQVQAGAKQGDIQAQNAKFQGTKAELAGQINSQTANIANLAAQLEGQTNSQQATIARLTAESNNTTKECQRYEFLLADGAIGVSERDRVCLQQETTQKQLQAAKVNLIKIKATLQQQINEAQANLERTKTTLTNQISEAEASLKALAEVRPVDVAVAQTELETAEAAVTKAQADLDLAAVKSPIDGQILEINTWPGEIVDNANGIVVVGNTQNMYVVAEVYETDIDRVRIGQSATITSDGVTKRLTGIVDDLGWQIGTKDVLGTDPVADADARVVKVKIRLNDQDSKRVANLTNLQVNAIINTSKQVQR